MIRFDSGSPTSSRLHRPMDLLLQPTDPLRCPFEHVETDSFDCFAILEFAFSHFFGMAMMAMAAGV